MLTKNKLKIYSQYNGDCDDWARSATKKQKDIINDIDWSMIDGLLQDITIIKSGLASKEYLEKTDRKIKDNCDCEETIKLLKRFAEQGL